MPTNSGKWSRGHKPRPDGLALALQDSRPGQSPQEATILARLGLAYLGLAWPSSQPEAGPCTSLEKSSPMMTIWLIISKSRLSKERLQTYFKENYPSQAPTALSSISSVSISSISSSSSPQKNYILNVFLPHKTAVYIVLKISNVFLPRKTAVYPFFLPVPYRLRVKKNALRYGLRVKYP